MKKAISFYIAISVAVLLTACASSLEKGNAAFKNKKYREAANHYYNCGKQGEAVCINNLGYIQMQYGYREKAIAHYRLAARMGDDYAINNLRELGEPVPEPDLVRPVQQSGSASILPLLNAIISGYNRGTDSSKSKTYKSSFGNKYEYDLSKPIDQIKYDIDLKAQQRDELDINPVRDLERDLGEYGAGVRR